MEDDQQFCLRWNNHQSTLIQNFDTLLESGTLVDCTLAAEGKYLKAHKVVLSACSPYFEGLLSEHYDKHPVFILKDVKFKELKAMMDYMYRGEVNISQDQLTALLKAAESLQIKGLSDSRTGGGAAGGSTTSSSKTETRSAKAASSTAATSSSLDIPHASSGLTIEKNSKVPRQSLQQVSVSDLPEDSASPQLRGLSSREGSQSPTSRKRLRKRKRSVNNDDTNSMENHEASNSSDVNISAPALGVAPVATEEKSHADPAETIGRSALMQQLTKPADEMLQIPIEKPEPSEEMIQPKSEYLDDQDDVEDLTNLDDDMNDLNEMEQDNSRAGPSHDPSQHGGIASWHISGDRSNASVVGAAAGPPGQQDEVFLAAHEAAQAQRDSQDTSTGKRKSSNDFIKILRVETLARPTSEKLQWKVVKRDNFEKFIMSKPKLLDPLAILQQTSTQSTSQKLQKKVPKKDNFTKLIIIPSKPSLVDPLSIGQETSAQSTGEKCQSKVVRKDNSPKIILNPNKPSIVDPLLIDQETSTQSTGEKSPEKVLKKDSFEKFFMNPDNPTLLDPLATIQETSTQPTSEKLPKKISKKDTLPKFFTNPDNPSLLDPLPVVQETLPRSTSEKLQLKVVRKDNFPKSILNPSKPSLLDPLLIELEPSTQSTSEKLQLKVIRKDSFPKSILNPSKPSLVDPLSIELEPSTQSTSEKSSEKVLEKDNLPKFFTNPSDPLLLDPLSVEQETLPQSTSETLQWKVLDKDNFQEFIVYQPVPIPSKQSSLDSIPMEFDVLSDSSETDGLQMKRLSTFEIKQLANEKIKQDLKLNKPVPTFKSKDEGIRKSTRKIKKKVFN